MLACDPVIKIEGKKGNIGTDFPNPLPVHVMLTPQDPSGETIGLETGATQIS